MESYINDIKNQFVMVMNTSYHQVISKIADKVETRFKSDSSGHDWWHVYRVWQMAKQLSVGCEVNLFIVELGALMHDMADHKLINPEEGYKQISSDLKQENVSSEAIDHVLHIARHISFKGAKVEQEKLSPEGEIVQDADRLDAIGAVGVARTFMFGGSRGNLMHDPDISPERHVDFESYKKSTAPVINHFYEKLLLLKDRMNTVRGREIAEERHRFMQTFLERFYDEWEGRK